MHMAAIKRSLVPLALLWAAPIAFGQQQELSLDECVRVALQQNMSILVARADADIALRKREEITAKLYPQLSAASDYRYYNDLPYQLMPAAVFGGPPGTFKEAQFGVPHVLTAQIQATMPIFNKSIFNGRSTAAAGADVAEYQYRKTREDAVLDVSNAYYNAQITFAQIEYLKGNIRNLGQLIAVTTLLHRNQLAKYSDAEKVLLQKSLLEAQLAAAEVSFQQLTGVLKLYLGMRQTDTISIQTRPPEDPPLSDAASDAAPNAETGIATDILIAQKMQDLVRSEIDGIYAGRYPTLAAYGTYGTTGYAAGENSSYQKFFPVSFVGVQLSLSLFDGGTIGSRAEQKTVELQKMELREKISVQKNEMEKTTLRLQMQVHRKNVRIQRENIRLAEKIFAQTQMQFKEGVAAIADVLQSDSALREAQSNYLTAMVKLKMAEVEWKKVTGTLL